MRSQTVQNLKMACRLRLRQYQKIWCSLGSEQRVQVDYARPRIQSVDTERMEHTIGRVAGPVAESGGSGTEKR